MQRVLVTSKVTISHTFSLDEVPTDAAATVTVTVRRLDGTIVTTGSATVGTVGDGTYTFDLPPSATVDTYTVDWVGQFAGVQLTARDFVEVVGGFYFGLSQARQDPPPLSVDRYPSAKLAEERVNVESDFDEICGQAFVPRFCRERRVGLGTPRIRLHWKMIRAVTACTINGVALSAPECAAIIPTEHGVIRRPNGAVFPKDADVVLEYQHGHDYPPAGINPAGRLWLRGRLGILTANVPLRALSFTVADGGTYRLSTPDKDHVGVPDVDAVLSRYPRRDRPGMA